MTRSVPMAELWRGPFLESSHSGHAVVCDATGQIVEAWGDPERIVLSRSACKMIQALPLVTSGAADAAGLTPRHLALACASHRGTPMHTDVVREWLKSLGLDDDDLRCGAHAPYDEETFHAMIREGESPCQLHNNCSGKHSGFLTLSRHLGAGPEYLEIDHPVQRAVRTAFEEVTQETSPGYGVDGCSAPNFASSLHGMARAMAHFAASPEGSAEFRLHEAMRLHPDMVAGPGRACTELMRAMQGKVAIKTGAEGFYTAILPERKLGVALKISDGATRASECAIASILVKLGVLEPDHPATRAVINTPVPNRRGIEAAFLRPAPALL